MGQLGEMIKKLFDLKPEVLQSKLAEVGEIFHGEASPMVQKVEAWVSFVEEEAEDTLKIVLPEKSQKELLMDIGEKEAADYYKYLCLPRTGILSHEEQVSAVAKTLRKHPEYQRAKSYLFGRISLSVGRCLYYFWMDKGS